ncbi:glutamate--cysteine ligase [Natronoglycomyces albus]|uniref:Glutamate--cysteine ligase n=1 Tax=Natronoglycomyces albus TaxID=2811108 RepID=A0A895XJ62_9ACTN|nr:glutamate--cysteine ligase [Natronoglycomyces albus]QSB05017.1 glutamate--cysteine ligase [Natronoglycomyces albus]
MGEEIDSDVKTRCDVDEYRRKLKVSLQALEEMQYDTHRFSDHRPMTGLELELDLVDRYGHPAYTSLAVLHHLKEAVAPHGEHAAPFSAQQELGSFNLEINMPPRGISGRGLTEYEADIQQAVKAVRECAAKTDSLACAIGTLPTLFVDHLRENILSQGERYRLLDEAIMSSRGEQILIDIVGAEAIRRRFDTIAPEAANTSVQFHIQTTPEDFARYWNASQAIAGLQLVVGANSPYLFGRHLWAETRIKLFEQGTDTRIASERASGAIPRVWFGREWVNNIIDLYRENNYHFHPLLPHCSDDDPLADLRDGRVPELKELRFHNGTIYRWNRPIYDIHAGVPHLRVENRVVPAGPTTADVCANMALYHGLVHYLVHEDNPVWKRMDFQLASRNFQIAARHGINADQYWPEFGWQPGRKLLLETLLPAAEQGLSAMGVAAEDSARYLGIIEQRCRRGVNGASWQVARVAMAEHRDRLERHDALRAMMLDYIAQSSTGLPVHEWAL